MTEEEFKLWATLKILKLREMLDFDNSLFTTTELDMLFAIKEQHKNEDRKKEKGKIVQLFQ